MSANRNDSDIDAKLEQEGLAFLHQARPVRTLDSVRVERIARRLRRPAVRRRRKLLVPAVAAVVVAMSAGATLAVAQGGLAALPIVGTLLGTLFSPKPPSVEGKTQPRGGRARALPKPSGRVPGGEEPAPFPKAEPVPAPSLATPPPPAALGDQAPAVQPSQAPAAARRAEPRKLALRDQAAPESHGDQRKSHGPTETPAASPEDPIVAESRSFAAAVESWHRQHDPSIALVLLDAYEHRYPTGHMRIEAKVLRAEVYLAQGQSERALSVLDAMSLSGIPRARELRTVRGELRVKVGRCHDARADLGEVLEKSMTDALAKRAAQALSHCP